MPTRADQSHIMRISPARGTLTILATVLLTLPPSAVPAASQTAMLLGRVSDSLTTKPLSGARIEVLRRDSTIAARALTGNDGGFRVSAVAAGTYTVRVALIGYQPRRITDVHLAPDTSATLYVVLQRLGTNLNPVVVSASRAPEKSLDAPASTSVVDTRTIEEQPTVTPTEHARDAPGVDMATTGIIQSHIVARGFNGVFSGALLVLTDYRYDFVPSLGVNTPWLIPNTNDDIERIEVVLGPAAALYGPNAAQGVLQIFTKSPFDWTGTTLTLGGISRAANPTGGAGGLLQAALRHAGTVGTRFGYKITAQLQSGTDWPEQDSTEAAARRTALAGGANAATLLTGRRDFGVRRWTAEAQADYRPDETTDLVFALGRTDAGNAVELTGVGAVQVRAWKYDYYQARFRHDRLFAQAFANLSDAGETYLLRTGQPVVDRSRMFVGQLQHGVDWGPRQSFTYGVDLQRTQPRTGGTTFGRNEGHDDVDEIGAYVQSETHISPRFDIVAAARLDRHNRLPTATFSPRAALVFKPTDSHTFRLTFNHAFDTPGTDNLFLDLYEGSFHQGDVALPFNVRLLGVPASGMYFRHDCAGGLCMRSPFSASPAQPLPLDATLVWRSLVALLQQGGGPDLSRIPAPTAADVQSVLRLLDITNPANPAFNDVSAADVRDIPPLRPTVTNTLEAGYKGVFGSRLRVALDLYYERKNDFIGPPIVETPNVFLKAGKVGDPSTLATYLSRYMAPARAESLATVIGSIPLGTVSPESWLTGNPDVILTYRNFGALDRWGSDVAAQLNLTDLVSLTGAYSWTNKDLFPRTEVGGFSDIALNAPPNKASLVLQYRGADRGMSVYGRGRYVAAFPMISGVYIGSVQSYALADMGLAYRLPHTPNLLLTVGAENLFNRQHREFVGAPVIGRLLMAQAQYTIP